MSTTPTGPQELSIVPHELNVWLSLRATALPGDTIRTSLTPIWDGAQQLSHAKWLAMLLETLDEGVEVHATECGSLRHGTAVARALQKCMADHEAETARQRAAARAEVQDAKAEADETYKAGFRDGQDAAQLAEKSLRERSQARERQRAKRERDAAEAAERDAAARRDISHPAYITSAA